MATRHKSFNTVLHIPMLKRRVGFRLPWRLTLRRRQPKPLVIAVESQTPDEPTATDLAQSPLFRPSGVALAQPRATSQPSAPAASDANSASQTAPPELGDQEVPVYITKEELKRARPQPESPGLQAKVEIMVENLTPNIPSILPNTMLRLEPSVPATIPPTSTTSITSVETLFPTQILESLVATETKPQEEREETIEGKEIEKKLENKEGINDIRIPPTSTTSKRGVEIPFPTQILESLVAIETKPQEEGEETIEGKEIEKKLENEEGINDITEEIDETTFDELVTTSSGSKVPTIKQPEKDEITGIEKLLPSNFKGHQTKTTVSHPEDMNNLSEVDQYNWPMFDGERVRLIKEIKADIRKFVRKMADQLPKHTENAISDCVTTLTSENKGVFMHLGLQEENQAPTSGEGRTEGKTWRVLKNDECKALNQCVNNNIQGINNSVKFNKFITDRDIDDKN